MFSDADILLAIAGSPLSAITIEPFTPTRLGANSYDVTLGQYFFLLTWDIGKRQPLYFGPLCLDKGEQIYIPPNTTVLGATVEVIGTQHDIVAIMKTRSTIGRMGMDACASAGLGDIGYSAPYVVELRAFDEVGGFLTVGQTFAQMYFERTENPALNPYSGQYSRQDWPFSMVPKQWRQNIIALDDPVSHRNERVRTWLRYCHPLSVASQQYASFVAGA